MRILAVRFISFPDSVFITFTRTTRTTRKGMHLLAPLRSELYVRLRLLPPIQRTVFPASLDPSPSYSVTLDTTDKQWTSGTGSIQVGQCRPVFESWTASVGLVRRQLYVLVTPSCAAGRLYARRFLVLLTAACGAVMPKLYNFFGVDVRKRGLCPR